MICRTVGHLGLARLQNLLHHLRIHRLYCTAELTGNELMRLLRNHLIALAGQDVHHCLCTYDLRRRGYERWLTEVLTNSRNFLENSVQLIDLASLVKLRDEVTEHTSRNLITKGVDINAEHLRGHKTRLQALLTIRLEVLGNLDELVYIDTCVVLGTLECLHHNVGRRLRSTKSERSGRGIDDICTRLYALQVGHGSHTGGVVGVDLDRKGGSLLEGLHEVIACLRKQKACHILDAEGICAEGLNITCEVLPVLEGIGITECIAECDLRVTALLLGCLYSRLEVTNIV